MTPLVITTFSDFKKLLEDTIQETEVNVKKYPELKMFGYILDQLKYIRIVLVYQGRKPTFNEEQSIDMGAPPWFVAHEPEQRGLLIKQVVINNLVKLNKYEKKSVSKKTKIFLSAEWRKLLIINYKVDPLLLQKYLPYRTEIDAWNNICYVSIVGFMFIDTKIKGFKIPFHINFEEVNLRFYVRYKSTDNQWKRGVVFIKEIVPKPLLTFVANFIYKENYQTMAMEHSWKNTSDSLTVEYKWKYKKWNSIHVVAENTLYDFAPDSEEDFITEHYLGYTKISDNKTSEYAVEHPKWQFYKPKQYTIDVDFGQLYGKEFDFLRNQEPSSVFLAEGSPILVRNANVI